MSFSDFIEWCFINNNIRIKYNKSVKKYVVSLDCLDEWYGLDDYDCILFEDVIDNIGIKGIIIMNVMDENYLLEGLVCDFNSIIINYNYSINQYLITFNNFAKLYILDDYLRIDNVITELGNYGIIL